MEGRELRVVYQRIRTREQPPEEAFGAARKGDGGVPRQPGAPANLDEGGVGQDVADGRERPAQERPRVARGRRDGVAHEPRLATEIVEFWLGEDGLRGPLDSTQESAGIPRVVEHGPAYQGWQVSERRELALCVDCPERLARRAQPCPWVRAPAEDGPVQEAWPGAQVGGDLFVGDHANQAVVGERGPEEPAGIQPEQGRIQVQLRQEQPVGVDTDVSVAPADTHAFGHLLEPFEELPARLLVQRPGSSQPQEEGVALLELGQQPAC